MHNKSFYCSGHTESNFNGLFEVKCKLPYTLDLTKGKQFEVSIQYACFRPQWLAMKELTLESTNSIGISEKCVFSGINESDQESVIIELQAQLIERFTTTDPRVKLEKSRGVWFMKIQKNSSVILSQKLADLLSLPTKIVNTDETRQKKIPITFYTDVLGVHEHVYIISSENVTRNFVNSYGKHGSIIDFINLDDHPNDHIFEYIPKLVKYTRLEGGLLSKIVIRLYNSQGDPIRSEKTDFYAILHVRPVIDYEETRLV